MSHDFITMGVLFLWAFSCGSFFQQWRNQKRLDRIDEQQVVQVFTADKKEDIWTVYGFNHSVCLVFGAFNLATGDFKNASILRVDGDFESVEARHIYAQSIADRLNKP